MDDAALFAALDRLADYLTAHHMDPAPIDAAKARIVERDAAVAAERERCARVAERLNDDFGLTERQAAQIIASEIRKGE